MSAFEQEMCLQWHLFAHVARRRHLPRLLECSALRTMDVPKTIKATSYPHEQLYLELLEVAQHCTCRLRRQRPLSQGVTCTAYDDSTAFLCSFTSSPRGTLKRLIDDVGC